MYKYSAYRDPKRILVTGGAGFIGSHLCERLVLDGHDVVCLDNFFTGTKKNISHLLDRSNFELLTHDITQPLMLEVDWIFNLACPASPIHYQYNPVKTTKVNVLGALHMLGLAKRVRARVMQASTSEVYGDPEVHPQKEEYWGNVNPIGRRSCYDEGKRDDETIFFDYLRQNKVDINVIRIFNTYGPRMRPDDGRVISNFIMQAIRGENITVYGDGSQTRSFCYIDDCVRGIDTLVESDYAKPLNIGSDRLVTIDELADMIIAISGKRITKEYDPTKPQGVRGRNADLSLVQREIGWKPIVPLEDGLRSTYRWIDKMICLKRATAWAEGR